MSHAICPERQTIGYIMTFYTAHGFTFPTGGYQGRRKALPAAIKIAARALKAVWQARLRGETDVASLVSYANAKGSIARYLQGKV